MDFDEAIFELERSILEAVGRAEEDTSEELRALAADILGQMKGGRFGGTGKLRGSMFANVTDGRELSIGMLFYGYFLSFGVAPNSASPLTPEVQAAFGVGDGYVFTTQRGRGIEQRRFYPTDVLDRVQSIVANVIQKIEI